MRKMTKQNANLRELVEAEDFKAVRAFLKNTQKTIVLKKDKDGHDALYYAIFTRNLNMVRVLIEYGFNPMDVGEADGATALHLAAAEGDFDLVDYLINDVKMDVNALDKKRHNPLYYALMMLNANDTNEKMLVRPGNLDSAWLLARKGCKFQLDMLGMQLELETLENSLLGFVHSGIKRLDDEHCTDYLNCIEFLNGALGTYKAFYNDMKKMLPDENLYGLPAFKNSKGKMPLVFGWQMKDDKAVNPVIYDLAKIAPLIVCVGDYDSDPVILFDNIEFSVCQKLNSADAKQVNIMTGPKCAFSMDHYFNNTENAEDKKEMAKAISNLSYEIDRRKKLPKSKLKNELPIICFIDDISQFTNKSVVGELQNIAFSGKDVGVYVIAVARGKVPSVLRANFQSVIMFHGAKRGAEKLKLDQMLFSSPSISGGQQIHIQMER